MQAAADSMYPAAIMHPPIITITLIIPMLLNPYFHRVPALPAGLTPAAADHPLKARPVPDINYHAVGAAAGRTLAAFCIFHSTPSFLLNFSLLVYCYVSLHKKTSNALRITQEMDRSSFWQ